MERKIGEIFELDGEWYQCIESDSCGECSLFTTECRSGTKSDLADKVAGLCSKVRRIDSKHAVFKKLEKIGEPFIIKGKKYQRYITHVHPYIFNELSSIPIDDSSVLIEIKQKDMEENKLNLKPFDIQKAREGKPVCTRDGRKVRIICFNRESIGFPIIALIKNGDTEGVYQFDDKGRSNIDDEERGYDLMMLPERKEGWVNIYALDCYSSKEEAEANIDQDYEQKYVRTVKIEWEE